jgi:hypothetical protein
LFRRKKALAVFDRVFRETMLRYVFEVRRLHIEGDLLMFYIRPEDGLELPEIMKWMKQSFAQRYNREAGRTGHIWGDRYWSRIVEGEMEEGGDVAETAALAGALDYGVRPLKGKTGAASGFPPHPPIRPPPHPAQERQTAA